MQSRERLPRREEERRLGLQRIRLASPVQAFNTEELFKTSNDGNRAAVAAIARARTDLAGQAVYGRCGKIDKILKGLPLRGVTGDAQPLQINHSECSLGILPPVNSPIIMKA